MPDTVLALRSARDQIDGKLRTDILIRFAAYRTLVHQELKRELITSPATFRLRGHRLAAF
jgi:hypothetical protein